MLSFIGNILQNLDVKKENKFYTGILTKTSVNLTSETIAQLDFSELSSGSLNGVAEIYVSIHHPNYHEVAFVRVLAAYTNGKVIVESSSNRISASYQGGVVTLKSTSYGSGWVGRYWYKYIRNQ